ncbi:MAG: hypothetical protein LQ346_005525 [Caloplaca aetnensis]|nr:MAG: hypothetical protein LQ346_005525 [Caloplaca aetnensis]
MEAPTGYFDDAVIDGTMAQSQRAQDQSSTTYRALESPLCEAARLQRPRKSKFMEVDVDGDNDEKSENLAASLHYPLPNIRSNARSRSSTCSTTQTESDDDSVSASVTPVFSLHPRLYWLTLLVLIALPLLYNTRWLGIPGTGMIGVSAGVIRNSDAVEEDGAGKRQQKRADTDTDVCSRWAGQSALVNGTIYLYGGHATQQPGQKEDTWTNDFLTVDLSKGWEISAPSVKGLPQPSGPPAVANGYLWNSYDSLYLYGGIVSDSPPAVPDPYSLWEYQIKAGKWVEHSNPKTSTGNNSDPGNQPVMQAGEGAGVSIPELGRGYYFAGHYDHYTTPGWSIQTNRTYLKALLEFTFPGHSNDGVQALAGGKTAGSDGAWRNVTTGGIQDTARFPNRADGSLVYVPGYGERGMLLSIGGGTEFSFVSLSPKPRVDE